MEKQSRIQELANDINALRKCCNILWKNRRMYIKYVAVGIVLSLIISFSIPKTFSSSVMLAPESQNGSSSSFSEMASLAGMSLGNVGGDAYTVELYPKIVSSLDFRLALSEIKLKSTNVPENEILYSDYLLKYNKIPWWKYPSKWTSKLISKIFTEEEKSDSVKVCAVNGPRLLSKKEYAVCNIINNRVRFTKEAGALYVTVSDFDPEVAALVADSVVARLGDFILDYRTSKARKQKEYAEMLCDSTYKKYMEVQNKYVKYAAAHNSIYSPQQKAEMEFLEKEVFLAYQSYSTAVSQKDVAQAKIMESIPVYTVIESAYVPLYADSPNKMLILIVFVMFSCVAATCKIFYLKLFNKK